MFVTRTGCRAIQHVFCCVHHVPQLPWFDFGKGIKGVASTKGDNTNYLFGNTNPMQQPSVLNAADIVEYLLGALKLLCGQLGHDLTNQAGRVVVV